MSKRVTAPVGTGRADARVNGWYGSSGRPSGANQLRDRSRARKEPRSAPLVSGAEAPEGATSSRVASSSTSGRVEVAKTVTSAGPPITVSSASGAVV